MGRSRIWTTQDPEKLDDGLDFKLSPSDTLGMSKSETNPDFFVLVADPTVFKS